MNEAQCIFSWGKAFTRLKPRSDYRFWILVTTRGQSSEIICFLISNKIRNEWCQCHIVSEGATRVIALTWSHGEAVTALRCGNEEGYMSLDGWWGRVVCPSLGTVKAIVRLTGSNRRLAAPSLANPKYQTCLKCIGVLRRIKTDPLIAHIARLSGTGNNTRSDSPSVYLRGESGLNQPDTQLFPLIFI